jgi:hypothetical protein
MITNRMAQILVVEFDDSEFIEFAVENYSI